MAKKVAKPERKSQRATVISISPIREITNEDGSKRRICNLGIVWDVGEEREWGQVACYDDAAARVFGLVMNLESLTYEQNLEPIQRDDIIEVSGNYRLEPFKKPKKKEFKKRLVPTWTLYFPKQIKRFGRPKADWTKLVGKEHLELA